MQLINLLLFSQHCFLSHFTPQYPDIIISANDAFPPNHYIRISTFASSVTCPFSTTKKHNSSLLSTITKTLLTHTIASFWRKQSCNVCCANSCWRIGFIPVTTGRSDHGVFVIHRYLVFMDTQHIEAWPKWPTVNRLHFQNFIEGKVWGHILVYIAHWSTETEMLTS